MKIVFVNDGIYEYATGASEAVGGLERDQWLLARMVAARGWEAVVGVRGPIPAGERKVIDGVQYVGLQPSQILLAWYQLLSSERAKWVMWEGACHILGPLVEIARVAGVRTIFHTAFDTDVLPRRALFRRRRWWPLYAWGLSRADRIFVQHTGQLSKLPKRLQSKAYVLPKICITSSHSGTVKPHAERAKYVAWVGMLRQPKRPDVLIEIARKAPTVPFIVCGGVTEHRCPPAYGDHIVKALRATSNIEYRGQVSPEEAAQVIADATLLLSTSDEEGFPNTFTQAWSTGTPVVTLKIDPDHIIERMGLGKVSGSLDGAIVDINALMDSPHCREQIAARARLYVADHHSEAAVSKTFNDAIQNTRRNGSGSESLLPSASD